MSEWVIILLYILAGISLFFLAIRLISNNIQKLFGHQLRKSFDHLPSNTLRALSIGFLFNSIAPYNSAGALTILGFTDISIISIEQTLGIILGANLGTAIMVWILALPFEKLYLVFIALGVGIRFIPKHKKTQYVGEIILGFGFLYLGMNILQQGFAFCQRFPQVTDLFSKINGSNYPSILWGILAGLAAALIVRSSKIVMGIVIAAASQGLIDLAGCVAIIMGNHIGIAFDIRRTCSQINYAMRAAVFTHTLFDIPWLFLSMALFHPLVTLVERLTPGLSHFTMRVALAYTLFNLTYVGLFVWFIPLVARFFRKKMPEPETLSEMKTTAFLPIDVRLLKMPVMAIAEVEKKLVMMAENTVKSALIVQDIIGSEIPMKKMCKEVLSTEAVIDETHRHITEFLVRIIDWPLSDSDARYVGNYLSLSHHIEKYADDLSSIILTYEEMERKQVTVTEQAMKNLIEIYREASNFFNISFGGFKEHIHPETFLEESRQVNVRIKNLIREAKMSHFLRIREKICNSEEAIYFIDLLHYMDGMRAQSSNIARINAGKKYKAMD
ncbi:MAG: Na/Pi cotransporter family protein [Candidatus Omnitrophota bacterium]